MNEMEFALRPDQFSCLMLALSDAISAQHSNGDLQRSADYLKLKKCLTAQMEAQCLTSIAS